MILINRDVGDYFSVVFVMAVWCTKPLVEAVPQWQVLGLVTKVPGTSQQIRWVTYGKIKYEYGRQCVFISSKSPL